MEDDFNTDKASQYTNNFLVALLKEEILEDKKDKFIQRISYYESLNYVRNSDFEKLVKELNLTVRDRKLCAKDEGDKIANDLLSDIFENESHADPSISHIKSFIGKGNVKQIEVFQKKGNKYLRRSVPIEKNHPSEFKRLIEVFDFDGLKNLRDINEARLSENSPELYLEQAYISYILFEYVKAYRYLRISSQLFYKKKDYVWYFISEFDRWNVGRLAWIDRRTGTSSEELDRIKTEVAAIDIEHVFQRIPVGQGEDKEFLKDLYTFKYYYSFFQEVYKKAKDAEKEAVTNYFFYGGKPGYESLRDMIQDCYDFDFNNFIMLDRYREDVETYKLYAKTILKSACSVDLSSGEQEDEFFCNGNVRVEQLTKLDLFIILRYMSGGELKEVLRNNCYQNLSIDKEAKTYLHTIIKNIAVITILDAQYFEKYLILVGYIELDKRIVTDTLLAINSRLNDWFIRTNYSELMRFLYWTDKQGILDIKEHSSILEHIIENLISINEISHYKNYAKAMLSRTLQIFMTVNDPYESDSLIQYLHSEDYEVLSEIYPYVAAKTKKEIQEICLKWKWDGELEKFSIYETMVLNEIITPRGNVEEQLLSALEKFKSNSEKRIPGSYESVIRSMVNLYINDKIIKKDEIKKVVEDSKIDEYVWLIDVELFSYESFNPEWLKKCTKRLLEIIVSISGVRKQIVERIRKTYMDGKADREILNIYFEYFAAH